MASPTVGGVSGLAAASSSGAPVAAAVITAAVAVVVAAVGQLETWRRERAGRRYERRRTALLEVQDAALAVRRALRVYGGELRLQLAGAVRPATTRTRFAPRVEERDLADAQGLLEVRAVRLDVDRLGTAVAQELQAWVQTSREHFLSPTDVSAGEEQAAWRQLNEAVAAALRG